MNAHTISFFWRHLLLFGAFFGLLSCIFLSSYSSANHAYFSIVANDSKLSLFLNTCPKATSFDTQLATRVTNFVHWIDGLNHQIKDLTAKLKSLSAEFDALQERCIGLQNSLNILFEVFDDDKKLN